MLKTRPSCEAGDGTARAALRQLRGARRPRWLGLPSGKTVRPDTPACQHPPALLSVRPPHKRQALCFLNRSQEPSVHGEEGNLSSEGERVVHEPTVSGT